jgi:cell wall-associated NlpC family hydrolase
MLALVFALATAAVPAHAAPLADKRADAARVKGEIDRLDDKMDIAVEDYNEAMVRTGELTAKVLDAKARLAGLGARIATLEGSLGVRVEAMYRTGPLGVLDVLLGAASFEDFATTWELLDQQNAADAVSLQELKSARAEAARTESELVGAQSQSKAQLGVAAERRRYIVSELEKRAGMLRGLEAEIAALEAQARARAAAAARRRTRSPGKTGPVISAPKGSVVEIAMRYLGKPYHWAASGPNSFDCSGFTMFVYSKVGVSLPHSSRAQYGRGQKVSKADLRPGDLVFFGRPIHHVGIYVGGGQMVHSPHSGDVVSVDALYSDYSGACRP